MKHPARLLAVWRRSIAEALDVIDLLDARITPLDHELGPLARADARAGCWTRSPASATCSGPRSRQRSATSRALAAAQADRLRRPGPEDQPVRRPLTHRRAVQGRLADAALGRRRSRPARLAAHQPLASALHRRRRACGQEPGQVRRRAQDPDRCLARPLPPAAVQARRAAPAQLLSRQAPAAFWPPDGPAWN